MEKNDLPTARTAQIEGYLSYCNSIEQNITRRYAANRFNYAIIGSLYTAIYFLTSSESEVILQENLLLAKLLPGLTFFLSITWIFQILRFQEISRIKFETVAHLEKQLNLNLINKESEITKKTGRWISYTNLELMTPIASMIASAFLLLPI